MTRLATHLHSVFPALDLADLDDPSDASVLPAFERTPLLGFSTTLGHFLFTSFRSKAGLPDSTDNQHPSDGRPEHRAAERDAMTHTPPDRDLTARGESP
jgi:hypothetical protein